jgi:hypothetical protein
VKRHSARIETRFLPRARHGAKAFELLQMIEIV